MSIEAVNALIVLSVGCTFVISSYFVRDRTVFNNSGTVIPYEFNQALRGFAIVLIVINHIGSFSGIRYFAPLGRIGVCIFLIISGYGLSEAYFRRGLVDFIKKRVLRVLLPFWILVFVFFVPSYFAGDTEKLVLVPSYLLMLRLPAREYWFIQFIFIWYIIFYVACRIPVQNNLKLLFVFIAGLLCLILADDYLVAGQAFSFLIGMLLSKYKTVIADFIATRKTAAAAGSALCALSGICLWVKQFPEVRNHAGTALFNFNEQATVAFAALCLIIFCTRLIDPSYQKIARLLGKSSYEIYLVHVLFLSLLTQKQMSALRVWIFLCITVCSASVFCFIAGRVSKFISPFLVRQNSVLSGHGP
ncbi:MAG: acyltransferase [Thermodesulfovibrionales bacterium]